MARFKLFTFLDGVTAAGDSAVYDLDSNYNADAARAYQGTLTTGDSIALKASVDGITFTTIATFTDTSFNGTLSGSWAAVKFTKTGTTGPATVMGKM